MFTLQKQVLSEHLYFRLWTTCYIFLASLLTHVVLINELIVYKRVIVLLGQVYDSFDLTRC